jgi:hypothetical protein
MNGEEKFTLEKIMRYEVIKSLLYGWKDKELKRRQLHCNFLSGKYRE